MEAVHFDRLTKTLIRPGTRRGLARLLAALPLAGVLATVPGAERAAGGGRHKRRSKRNKRRSGDDKDNRKGKRKGKNGRGKATTPTACTKRPCPATACGSQPDGCGGTLQCGCGAKQLCVEGACRTCDVCGSGCAFTSVQAAIDATTPQLETIVVCPGIYVDHAHHQIAMLIKRSLRLIGAGDGADPTSNTHLRPGSTDQNVMLIAPSAGFPPPEELQVTLEGLRLTGATGDSGRGLGVNRAIVALINSTIAENQNLNTGQGGLFVFGAAQVTLTNTHITGNRGATGGIEVDGSSRVTFDTLSRVTRNTATGGFGGILNSSPGIVELPSVANVTDNISSGTNKNCGGDGTFTGPGAICTTT
jgi:hypothetical protein